MWCIWRERNRHTFEDVESSGSSFLHHLQGLYLIGLGLGDSHLVILNLYIPFVLVHSFESLLYVFGDLVFFSMK